MAAQASYDGRSNIRLAVTFYGVCVGLAVVWSWLIGRPHLIYDPVRSTWSSAGLGTLAGLGCGLVTVWLSRLLLRRCQWAEHLFRWFGEILSPLSRRDAVILACLSGVGEELLFRGPMLHTLGLYLSTVIFALLHFPPRRELWPWTAMAGALGLIFGQLALWSGNLAGPITAHIVINGLNLLQVAALAGEEKLLPDGAESSMGHHAITLPIDAPPDGPLPEGPPADPDSGPPRAGERQ